MTRAVDATGRPNRHDRKQRCLGGSSDTPNAAEIALVSVIGSGEVFASRRGRRGRCCDPARSVRGALRAFLFARHALADGTPTIAPTSLGRARARIRQITGRET